jgi:hypothetical protein
MLVENAAPEIAIAVARSVLRPFMRHCDVGA